MQLLDYQQRVFNKLLKFDKSFMFWPRQTGKSQILIAILEYFIQNNKDINILFIVHNKESIKNLLSKVYREIGSLVVDRHRTDDYLYFINNNSCKFSEIHNCTLSIMNLLKPTIILYDELWINNVNDLAILKHYIKISKCKSIFTSTRVDLDIIKLLDSNNDYYINIMPVFDDEHKIDFNLNKEIIKELSYKPDHLLDYGDVVYQRKVKLKKLKEISDGE